MGALLAPAPVMRFYDNNNFPLAGGQLYTYQAGTTTPAATYTDSTAITQNPNPVVMNARGEAPVWLSPTQAYKFVLKDASGNTIWTADQITSPAPVAVGNMTDEKGSDGNPGFKAGTDFTPGTTASLTLSNNYGSAANLWVAFDAAEQGTDSYSLSGMTLTFNAPIPSGTSKVYVKGGTALTIGTPGSGVVTDASVAANAAIQSSKLQFTSLTAPSSTIRSVQSKLSDVVSVTDYAPAGSLGLGVNSDYAAFNAAITNNPGKAIYVPDPPINYVLDKTLTIPANTTLYGEGKFSTKIFKSGNNDMFSLGDGAVLRDMWIDGQGASNTGGRGVLVGAINASDGHQSLQNCRVINFPDVCLDFVNTSSGSQFSAINFEMNQYGATTGSNRFAIRIADASQLSAVPRSFVCGEFNGAPSFNFGGCNDLFVSDCFMGDLNYTLNSRGVQISASRIANQSALSIYGHNHTIVGCDVNPQVTLTPGVDNCHIGPNSLNNAPIVDNSGNGRNQVFDWNTSYTPGFYTTGSGPSLGNGGVSGRWIRSGALINLSIQFAPGTTTSFGTGQIGFGLPAQAPNASDVNQIGTWMVNHGGVFYTGVVELAANSNIAYLLRDTTGSVTGTSPATWGNGDLFNITISYSSGV